MKKVTRAELAKMLRSGDFVTVTFIKKDESVRVLNGRHGVKKFLKGGKRTSDPKDYVMMYESGQKPRNVRIDRIISVRYKGETYIPANPINVSVN